MKNTPKKIIIIEDDASLRRGLKLFFTNEGFTSSDFETGEKALEFATETPPDLIFCDYRLPGANGLETMRRMQKAGIRSPFVIMTAYCSDKLKEKALAGGAMAILEKPLDLTELKRFC